MKYKRTFNDAISDERSIEEKFQNSLTNMCWICKFYFKDEPGRIFKKTYVKVGLIGMKPEEYMPLKPVLRNICKECYKVNDLQKINGSFDIDDTPEKYEEFLNENKN